MASSTIGPQEATEVPHGNFIVIKTWKIGVQIGSCMVVSWPILPSRLYAQLVAAEVR